MFVQGRKRRGERKERRNDSAAVLDQQSGPQREEAVDTCLKDSSLIVRKGKGELSQCGGCCHCPVTPGGEWPRPLPWHLVSGGLGPQS